MASTRTLQTIPEQIPNHFSNISSGSINTLNQNVESFMVLWSFGYFGNSIFFAIRTFEISKFENVEKFWFFFQFWFFLNDETN